MCACASVVPIADINHQPFAWSKRRLKSRPRFEIISAGRFLFQTWALILSLCFDRAERLMVDVRYWHKADVRADLTFSGVAPKFEGASIKI